MIGVVRGVRADVARWREAPRSPLVDQGFEIVEDLLSQPECDRLREVFDRLRHDGGPPPGEAYWVDRAGGPTQRDQHVLQLMNAQDVDARLGDLHRSGVVERLFSERLGEELVLESTTIQQDDPDTETKRGFHVDRVTPPTFKLFTYLTDVQDLTHGPYTVIPGSHRHVGRKLLNVAWNKVQRRQATDMALGYRLPRAEPLLGPRGRTILSAQTVVHRGWPDHRTQRRLVLICYLSLARTWSGRPFELGKGHAATAPPLVRPGRTASRPG